jgi:hypothetical protein
MTVDSRAFARNMLLEASDTELETALLRERDAMWPMIGEIEGIDVSASQQVVDLSSQAFSVYLVAYNGTLLTKGFEAVLDAIDVNWRNANAAPPRNYLYMGELPSRQIRLHPKPDVDGLLQVITRREAPMNLRAKWHGMYLGLALIEKLAISDPLRSRPRLAEIAKLMKGLVNASFGRADYRRERQ